MAKSFFKQKSVNICPLLFIVHSIVRAFPLWFNTGHFLSKICHYANDREDRGAERPRGGVWGGVCPSPADYTGLGERCKFPGPGGALAANEFGEFYMATSRLCLTDKSDFVPVM